MGAEYPYDGTPPPSGILMDRAQYDVDNDGVVDIAKVALSAPVAGFAKELRNLALDVTADGVAYLLVDSSMGTSQNWDSRELFDATGRSCFDYQLRRLSDTLLAVTLNWETRQVNGVWTAKDGLFVEGVATVFFGVFDVALGIKDGGGNLTHMLGKNTVTQEPGFLFQNQTSGVVCFFAASNVTYGSAAVFGSGTPDDVIISTANVASTRFTVSGDVKVLVGELFVEVAGKGLTVKGGANARIGTAILVGGTVTVANTNITAQSRILVTSQVDGGVVGFLRVNNIVAGVSFDIVSSNALDTSTVAYWIVEES